MRRISNEEWVVKLEEAGVIRHDVHVVLSSGRHTKTYANFAPGMVPRGIRHSLIPEVAVLVDKSAGAIVATGCGSYYALQVADLLDMPFVYAERGDNGIFTFKRDQAQLIAQKNVVLFDDVLITTTTLAKLGKLVTVFGGTPVQALVLLNRSERINVVPDIGCEVPISQIIQKTFPMWAPPEIPCPECAQGKVPHPNIEGGEQVFRQHGYRAQS